MSTEDMSTEAIKARIIDKVRQIGQAKEAKKNATKSHNETIKTLEEEIDTLLSDLEDAQRAELEAEAEEMVKESFDKSRKKV